jgi:hypothetical protein
MLSAVLVGAAVAVLVALMTVAAIGLVWLSSTPLPHLGLDLVRNTFTWGSGS